MADFPIIVVSPNRRCHCYARGGIAAKGQNRCCDGMASRCPIR
jgi:hypothetical protein